MSDNENTSITVVTKEEFPSFIKKKHELSALLKCIEAGSKEAVGVLIETIGNKEVDLKLRVQCAKDLIQFQTQIADQISKDGMNRLIAEIKIAGSATPRLSGTTEKEADNTPVLDFSNIRGVD